jgi:hypothetical protein
MALIAPPSARPLDCGMTFPSPPMLRAPPAIAARTAARNSSSLTAAGRYAAGASFHALLVREIHATAFVVHINRLAALLDAAALYLDHIVVGQITTQLDFDFCIGNDGCRGEAFVPCRHFCETR